jgi:CPA2 family monovalent cation:H+ antiporter-2
VAELDIAGLNVEVREVRRNDQELPLTESILQAGDTLLLCGPLDAVEAAEARLLARRHSR